MTINLKKISQQLILLLFFFNVGHLALSNKNQTTPSHFKELLNLASQVSRPAEKVTLYERAFELVQSQGKRSEIIHTGIETAQLLIEQNQLDKTLQIIDKCLTFAKSGSFKREEAELYVLTGKTKIKKQQYETARDELLKAIELLSQIENTQLEGDVHNLMGATHWYQRNYAEALEFFKKALQNAIETQNILLQAKANGNIGIVYNQLANYEKAIEYHTTEFELARKIENYALESSALNSLGTLYYSLNQPLKAIEVYNKAKNIYASQNDTSGMSQCMNNLGEVYLKQGNRTKALEHYEVALKIEENYNDNKMKALLHNNIGRVFLLDKNYKQAISHFENTLSLLEKNKDRSIEAEVYYNLAQTFMASGKSALAESYFHRAVESTMSLGENELLSKAYNSLSQFYYKKGDYKKSYDYLSAYTSIKDSIVNEKTIENMARMDAIYETVQNEETIKMLEKENRTKEENLYKEKIMQLIYLLTSVSLLFLSIALFALYRVKQKSSKELAAVNRELHQLNATKDRFFSIISHDLKSPINSILGFTEMLNLHVETHSKAELLQYSQIINSSTKNLASLVDNLLLWSRTQVGATSYTPERIDITIHCQNIISLLRFSAEEKDIILTGKFEKNLIAIADSNLFNTVVRNLLSNAIKFSKIGGTIIIATKQVKNQIQVSVADNGVGILPENLDKLFRIDTNVSTRGTFNEKGSGLGLILCKEFVEINKGTIWVESEPDKGSTFTFTVPMA
jgi:signal transduction histidine kinase/uncharacterized protein HemY